MKIFSQNTNIGLRHFRAAVTVMDEGSFSSAANRLGVVPSALTETVRLLELECGTPIFDRKVRPVRATVTGAEFLEEAREVLDRFERSLISLRQIGGLKRGKVAIGAAPSAVLAPLVGTIKAFRSDFPDVDIVIHDDVAEKLASMVVNKTLDFALAARGVAAFELDERKIGEDHFGLVCHRDHPLAQTSRALFLNDIDPADLIALTDQAGINRMLAAHPGLSPALLKGRIQTYSTIAQLTLISHNAGVALLPEKAVRVIQSDALVFRTVDDFKLVRSIFLLTRSRSSPSLAASRFLQCLLSQSDQFIAPRGRISDNIKANLA